MQVLGTYQHGFRLIFAGDYQLTILDSNINLTLTKACYCYLYFKGIFAGLEYVVGWIVVGAGMINLVHDTTKQTIYTN